MNFNIHFVKIFNIGVSVVVDFPRIQTTVSSVSDSGTWNISDSETWIHCYETVEARLSKHCKQIVNPLRQPVVFAASILQIA